MKKFLNGTKARLLAELTTHPSLERFCRTEVALPSLKGPAHSILYISMIIGHSSLSLFASNHIGTKDPWY